MTIDRGRCPPPPPDGVHAELATTSIHFNPDPCVRVFWKGRDPLAFGQSRDGNRFDPLVAPWAATKVLYGGTSLETAVAEVLLRWHGQLKPGQRVLLSESEQLKDRRVARFAPKRTLTLIDATALGLAPIEEAVTAVVSRPEHAENWAGRPKPTADDIFQCSANDYAQTQRWGSWFRSQSPDADGVMWVSRQFNIGRCIVLFDDRCGDQLELTEEPVSLYADESRERDVVDRMLGQLRWGVEKSPGRRASAPALAKGSAKKK